MITWTLLHLCGMCCTAPEMTAATFSRQCASEKDDRAALQSSMHSHQTTGTCRDDQR